MASKVTSNRTAPEASRVRREKAFMVRATARPPSSSSRSNPQAVRLSKATGAALRLRLELVGIRPPQKRWLREPNLLRRQRLRRRVTTTCTFAYRRRRWRQWIPGAPRRCSTMFLRALGRKMPHQSFNQFRCSCRHLCRSGLEIPAPFCTRVSVLQLDESDDTSANMVDTEPHLEALTQRVAGSCGSRCVRGC